MAFRWLRKLWRPYAPVDGLASLVAGSDRRVLLEGTADAENPLLDPLDGSPCVAILYRAWPPSTTTGVDGATSHNSRAYQVNAHQNRDFVLSDGTSQVLVRVDPGEDLGALHERLLQRHGVGLRAETEVVSTGQRVRVWASVEHRGAGSRSPHRELPYIAIVRADRFGIA